ncbi:hypothetical protein [Nocardia sp. NPDC048505]|uniref:hypothetical protein n=1 Tax=unclassified Nocardia TaxID=2637762 RepID=UPI0033C8F9BF
MYDELGHMPVDADCAGDRRVEGVRRAAEIAAAVLLWLIAAFLTLALGLYFLFALGGSGTPSSPSCDGGHNTAPGCDAERNSAALGWLALSFLAVPIAAAAANIAVAAGQRRARRAGRARRGWPLFVWPLLCMALQLLCFWAAQAFV